MAEERARAERAAEAARPVGPAKPGSEQEAADGADGAYGGNLRPGEGERCGPAARVAPFTLRARAVASAWRASIRLRSARWWPFTAYFTP